MDNFLIEEININNIKDFINSYKPFVYLKLGDGEYIAANKYSNINSTSIIGLNGLDINTQKQNCDGVIYSKNLQNYLINSCQYLLKLPNCYVGKWHGDLYKYWESLINSSVNWASYHMFIIYDKNEFNYNVKLDLYKSIKLYCKSCFTRKI